MTNSDLPYYQNFGANSPVASIVLIVITGVLFGLHFAGYAQVPLWAGFVPPALVAVRYFFYGLIRNAVHEGNRMAQADAMLDKVAQGRIDHQSRTGLTPARLFDKLTEGAE